MLRAIQHVALMITLIICICVAWLLGPTQKPFTDRMLAVLGDVDADDKVRGTVYKNSTNV